LGRPSPPIGERKGGEGGEVKRVRVVREGGGEVAADGVGSTLDREGGGWPVRLREGGGRFASSR
jgi:hypothetical protein